MGSIIESTFIHLLIDKWTLFFISYEILLGNKYSFIFIVICFLLFFSLKFRYYMLTLLFVFHYSPTNSLFSPLLLFSSRREDSMGFEAVRRTCWEEKRGKKKGWGSLLFWFCLFVVSSSLFPFLKRREIDLNAKM